MTRIALLDLDGTLLDTRPGILLSWNFALTSLGHSPLPADADINWMIGPPLEDAMVRMLAERGDDRTEQGVALYRQEYGVRGMLACAPYPGIALALAELYADGWTLFVATSKRTRFAVPILQNFDLAGAFHTIYGSEEGPRLDRKADLLAHILVQEGFDPSRAVMVGDRATDIDAARQTGMQAIGALWGYGSAAELSGADALCEHPDDLAGVAATLIKD